MVYRGKLGKGCAECRKKKTRCDAKRPSCGQCRRAGRICSGYRDLDALRLVDQTIDVSKRLKRMSQSDSSDTSSSPEPQSTPEDASLVTSRRSSKETLEALSSLTSFVDPYFWAIHGINSVFFDQFISVYSAYPKTELDFVAGLFGDVSPDGSLASIVSALGYIALPADLKDISLSNLASEKYSSALRQTQKALRDPTLAKSDETLATVILLGLHELFGADEFNSDTTRLSVHLDGSIRLLQLRGEDGMCHTNGTRMFHRLCSHILSSALHGRRRIPKALLKYQHTIRQYFHPEEIMAADLLGIAAKLCDILASSVVVEPSEVASNFETLLKIEKDLKLWEEQISFRLQWERVELEPHPDNFLKHKDMYLNHIAASLMNRYRMVRIQTNEEIIRLSEIMPEVLSSAVQDTTVQASLARSHIITLSEEVAYSLPFFFGDEACRKDQTKIHYESRAAMHAATVTLMPIYFAASSKVLQPAMYSWLMQHLKRIGDELGIGQARALYRERVMLETVG